MKKIKVLALSALLAVLSLTLVVGGTYAIFSSESKADISVTSGKVKVSAEISDLKMYSGAWNGEDGIYDMIEVTDNFSNGGTAVIDENGSLVLDKISPLDKVTFKVTVTNESNIVINQRIKIKTTDNDGLFEALEIKVDDVAFTGTSVTQWTLTQPGEGNCVKEISVLLPEMAGNEYQDKTCKIVFTVEALQANANTCDHATIGGYLYDEATGKLTAKVCEDCEGSMALTADDLEALEGKILVKHANDAYYTISTKTMGQEVAGQTAAVNFVLCPSDTTYSLVGQFANSGSAVVNVYGVKNGDEYLSKLYSSNGSTYISMGVDLTIKNMEMVGTTSGGWYRGLQTNKLNYFNCHFTGGTTAYSDETNFTDCTFDSTNIDNGGKADYSVYCYNTKSTFTNCSFVSAGKAVKVYSEGTRVGNEFNFINCTFTIGETLLTSKSDKAAIQIDSSLQGTETYKVNCTGCTQTGYDGGLAADSSTKSVITIND